MRFSTPALRSVVGVSLSVGLAVTALATATPAGAGENMKSELHRLRLCESGNNYQENTGNGYYGAYQFSTQTWQGLGFGGRPDQAPKADQDRAARRLHAESGWGAWPSCARTQHLR